MLIKSLYFNMQKPIPYGKQFISKEDINAVVESLNSDYLTQGPLINDFEQKFADYIGSKFAIAVSNGTAALHLCTLALKVSEGDKVITTPITFAASANCIKYCGGEVVFADIDSRTYLIDYKKVEKLLEASPIGTYKGLILVDFAGRAIDFEKFSVLAKKFNLWIIEDACHAPGGSFKDSNGQIQNCGNSNFADLAIFSFHPVKHIACGEGGMITTNNKELYTKLLKLRTHGITKTNDEFVNDIKWAQGGENTSIEDHKYPGWYMEMQQLGFNYRLTDFQAALGISQLKRADLGIEKRIKIAEKYNNAFCNCSFIKGQSGLVKGHAYHLYIIEVNNRLGLYNFLKENNIFAQIHYIPTHLMPYYKQFGWKIGDLPIAESYYESCISLPMYPTLTEIEQDFVINKIKEFYNG
jgi:UDP-4-amino-4,6-dideoxy-N-acetyl-beta-L-altrosamine transaminase